MLLRTIVIAALVAAPMAWSPASATAQERGVERATEASAQAQNDEAGRPSLPRGIARVFAGLPLPRGIARFFGEPEPEPVPAPEPEPEEPVEEECATTIVWVNGQPMQEDCEGNQTPVT